MPALAEIHLVSDGDDFLQGCRLQMISLSDHLADAGEALKAPRLRSPQREALEVRHYRIHEFVDRPTFELESPVRSRFTDPAASEIRLLTLQQWPIALVQ